MRLRRASLNRLADATRQVATLLAAGLPVVTTLATIQEQTEDPDFSRMLALVREEVQSGESLAEALGKHKEYFSQEYVHLVRAGEMGGALDSVMERLADNLERRASRRAAVTAALAYPAFMTVVGAVVLFFLLSFIVPTLTDLFENLHAALPWPTRMLLAISGFLHDFWYLAVLGVAAAAVGFVRYYRTPRGYRRVEAFIFKLPLMGSLVQRLRLAHCLRSLAVMTGGGVALTTALNVAAKGLGHSAYAAAMEQAQQLVGQGRSLADSLAASGLFPPVARRMVAVGESSGTLTSMLGRVAQAYEEETDRALSTLTSLVEPVIILTMGATGGLRRPGGITAHLRPLRSGWIGGNLMTEQKNSRRPAKVRPGFTLIEILVVVIILGILAGLVVPRIMDQPEKARVTKARMQIESLEAALKLFKLDNGYYPTTEQGLDSLVRKPTTGRIPPRWREGGYLEKGQVPKDPWERDFVYLSPGSHNHDFDLYSYGSDGEPGGEGPDSDITNWVDQGSSS